MTGLLAALLPAPIVVVETFTDPPGLEPFPEEAAVIEHAVEKRRREFLTVRHCARRAFGELGVGPAPIVPGLRGAPTWPDGIVGSMTHCAGYRAAAVARSVDVRSIGVDAEPAEPLPEGILAAIGLPDEQAAVAGLAARRPGIPWDRLLFSAKEAVYKAWFPLAEVFLDFSEARVSLGHGGGFTARVLVPAPRRSVPVFYSGRWAMYSGLLVTAIAVGDHGPPASQ